MMELQELVAERDRLSALIQTGQEGAKKQADAEWAKIKIVYDYQVDSVGKHQVRFTQKMTKKSSDEIGAWAEKWKWCGRSAPYGMGTPEERMARNGMTYWLVRDGDGEPILISEGGGTIIIRSANPRDVFCRDPIYLTPDELSAILRCEVPKSLILKRR